MPITHSPQRDRQEQLVTEISSDVSILHQPTTESMSHELVTIDEGLTDTSHHNQPQTATENIEQVTLNFNRSMEQMQQQMSAILAVVQAQNLDMQKSITSLRNEIRGVNTNTPSMDHQHSNAQCTSQASILTATSGEMAQNNDRSQNVVIPASIAPSLSNNPLRTTFENFQNSTSIPPTQYITSALDFPPPEAAASHSVLNIPCRQKKIYSLPKFSGSPEDWQTFYESFKSSTAEFEYSDLHNIMRLRDSLEGEAKDTVESLMTNSKNVSSIISILSETFGRPEQLIKSQIHKIRSLPSLEESDFNALIIFANKVTNMNTFIESVGGDYHLSNPMLLSELVAKLPISNRLQWANKCLTLGRMPTIKDFSLWLGDLRKTVNMVTDLLPIPHDSKNYVCASTEVCGICGNNCKTIASCQEFRKLSTEMRWEKVKSLRACFSCLRSGHPAMKCQLKRQCGKNSCTRYHHHLLHSYQPASTNNHVSKDVGPSDRKSTTNNQSRSCQAGVNSGKNKVLFQIVPVKIYGINKIEVIYAFVDDGANVSMIDAEVVQNLGIKGRNEVLELQWINNQVSKERTQVVNITISSNENCSEKYCMNNVTNKLDLPQQSLDLSRIDQDYKYQCTPGMYLSNYDNAKPKMIISLAHAFLTVGIEIPRMLSSSGPIATKTRLGWIVYGPLKQSNRKFTSCHVFRSEKDSESFAEIEQLMKGYFGLETFGVRNPAVPILSKDDRRALEILETTTKRKNNRFESGLLWREDSPNLPDSYGMALKRLITVEKRMTKDTDFAKEYCDKIEEYVKKGYARVMSKEESAIRPEKTFYLPHFGVLNPNKKKMRLVFDAAAEVQGLSLNKALLSGPDINQPLLSVLFKFRQEKIAVCADIKEMFHQVAIIDEDQHAQRFLWRNGDPSQPPKTYLMQRMTFGATCSPSMAQYVKNKNAMEFIEQYPRAVKGIIEKHYVDDYVDCFDSESEAVDVVRAVKEIHRAGGFEIHNILTNSSFVAHELDVADITGSLDIGKGVERILGMHWMSKSDEFVFVLKFHKVPVDVLHLKRVPTKRELLCITMSIFDPLGFVADFMVYMKILMQDVWRSGIGWDEKIPDHIKTRFQSWIDELKRLEQFRISRFYFEGCCDRRLQLHVFCDASEQAMATVAYWRIQFPNGVKVSFITGKTSCAPLRFHTIPKLELQAAVMAVRLGECIKKNHEVKANEYFLWSDSHTVIRWIQSDHRKYKQYVANRVSEILEYSQESQWRWCPTSDNPADKGTRAKFPLNYNPEGIWKLGPKFLLDDEEKWPVVHGMVSEEDKSEEEIKSKFFVMVSNFCGDIIDNIINRTSKYLKVRRQVAWIRRFVENLQRTKIGEDTIKNELNVDEEVNAEYLICQEIQRKYFSEEYKCLKSSKPILKSSEILTLNPYIDENGVIRASGRLDNATILPEYTRRPIILPKTHRYSRIIIEFYHEKNCHQNSSKVVCDVRERFWIPSIRRLLRSVESRCTRCKLMKAKPEQPQMSILPKDRVTPFVRPFSYTGVDLFGPFDVKIRRGTEKRWVALFTCLTIRAVHLEMVKDLSTDSFLLCLRNFINRRGVPILIRSDNGRNFTGIKRELRNEANFLDHNEMTRSLTPLGIKWVFNTPMDPSAGGAFPAAEIARPSIYKTCGRPYLARTSICKACEKHDF